MSRLSRDAWAMGLAEITAKRATCCRRAVGCVLLNVKGHVLSTGYNGVAAGLPHCNEIITNPRGIDVYPNACLIGSTSVSGQHLDWCQAIHAEQNALLQCRDVYEVHTAYVTVSPCTTCCKLLLNTGCQRIVYLDEYTHTIAKDIWQSTGRMWEQLTL